MALSPCLQPVTWLELPGWADDDHAGAFAAFRRSADAALTRSCRDGSLGIPFSSFAGSHAAARKLGKLDTAAARAFFEQHFSPSRVVPEGGGQGFVTGYYEPVAEASPVKSATHRFPIYRRPDDLADVDETNRPSGLDPYFAFARKTAAGLEEYHDRSAIESGALAGRGLEIAWLDDPVDVFFIHVQGAARLVMPDGHAMRITYAAKSGHHFTGPGGILVTMGEIQRDTVSMQAIRSWFKANPHRVNEILWQNRSFIFFREAPVDDAALGPVAAAKVPLSPGRSIAVDRLLHTFSTPFYIVAPSVNGFGGRGLSRLMIAQDTGSAITGPARADLFAGSGNAAGDIAGVIRNAADFFVLVPKGFNDCGAAS